MQNKSNYKKAYLTRISTAVVTAASILVALFCIYGLSRGYITTSGPLINPSSIFAVLWFAAMAAMLWFAFYKLTLRDFVICGLSGLVFSCFTCCGAHFLVLGRLPLDTSLLYINIIALAFVFAAFLRIIFLLSPIVKEWLYNYNFDTVNKYIEKHRASVYLILFASFIILWISPFLALFPGYLSYDGPLQLKQVFISHQLDAHHPVAHTMLITLCFNLGNWLFSSNAAGLAIYSVIQALIVGAVFAYLGIFMLRHNVPKLIVLISMLFLAINPIIQIFVFTTAKDVLFGAFFLLLLLLTVDYVTDPKEFFSHPKYMIRYAFVMILMALMKKQGIYILVLALPFILWIGRKHLLKAACTFLSGVLIIIVFYGPVSNALNIIPGSSREMLSVSIQQIVRVIKTDPESLSEEDKNEIRRYIPENVWDTYIPEISDPVKDNFIDEAFSSDPAGFIKLWIKLGMEHPNIYADAFAYLTYPYWYPSVETSHPWSGLADFYALEGFPVEQHSLSPSYLEYLMDVGQEYSGDSPLLSASVCIAMPVWGLLLCCIVIFRQRKYNLLIPVLMMLAFLGSLLLGPVSCIRYIFPLLIACPLLISLPFIRTEQKLPSKGFMEIFRFAVNGVFCFVIDWGTMMLLMKLTPLPDWVCIAAGFILSVIVNYIICVIWVFEDAGKQTLASQVVFIGSSVVGLGLTELFMLIFIKFMPVTIAKVIVALIVMVWNYIAKRFAIYRINPKLQKKG